MKFRCRKKKYKNRLHLYPFNVTNGIYSPVRKGKFLATRKGGFLSYFLKPSFGLLPRVSSKNRLRKVVLEKIKSPKALIPIAVATLPFILFVFSTILKSQAAVSTYLKQWTTQTDFENNASTVGTATTKTNVDTATTSGSVKLSTSSVTITQTDDGTTDGTTLTGTPNTNFNLNVHSHNQTTLTGSGNGASVQLAVSGQGGNFKLAVGFGSHTCAIKGDGTLYCWGWNTYGQLGDNTTTDKHFPVQVHGVNNSGYLTGVSAVAESYHTCALKADGTAFCWGNNTNGQIGDNTTTQRLTPVQICDAGTTDNSGNCGGTGHYLSGIISIATGDTHTCALRTDGTVYCWGNNTNGQLGDNTTTQRNAPVRVCAPNTTATDGTCGGAGHYLTGVSAIVTGYSHTCALKTDGMVYCWGYNGNGRLGDNTTTQRLMPIQVLGVGGSGNLSGVSAIAAAGDSSHTCALKTDGTACCWGNNSSGQLGDNTTTQKLAPVQVFGIGGTGNLSGVSAISVGYYNTCALKTDGTACCWGNNSSGQLGDNTTTQRLTPVQICDAGTTDNSGNCGGTGHYLSGITATANDATHTCALKSDSTVYCWGGNTYGKLGDNTTTQRLTPIQVHGVNDSGYLILSTTHYYSSGTFTSGIIDLSASNAFSTLSWTNSGGQTITVKARTCDDAGCSSTGSVNESITKAWSSCGNISNGALLTSGAPNCVTAGNRYLQYQATLSTSDTSFTPSLDDITFVYSGAYASSGTITKLLVDAGAQAVFTNINWNGTNTANTAIKFRTRGITDAQCTSYGSCASAWTALSPTLQWSNCDGASGLNTGLCSGGYYTVSNAYITANNASSTYPAYRYLEIELTLTTSNGGESPQLNDFMVGYKKNTPPTVAHDITPVQGSDGLVHLTYDISDADTAEGINQPSYTDVSFQYWDGSVWHPASSLLKADKVTPAGAADGVGHVAVSASTSTFNLYWNAKTDVPAPGLFLNNTAKLRINVNDGEALNNTASATSAVFTMDTNNPVPGATPIKINAATAPASLILSATDDSALQMKVGFASDLSDVPSWSSYSTSTTLALPADPSTVYVQFKDVYNNSSAIKQLTTIETPTNVVIRDVSNVSTNTYALFTAWKSFSGVNFKQYDIYRAATTNATCPGSGYSIVTTISDKSTNYYLDPNLSNVNTYCYKIVNEDTNGNASFYSTVVYKKPTGQGGTDNTPPAISAVQVASTTTQTATIQWDTDELSNSNVDYSTTTNFSNAPDIGVSSMKGGGVGLHKVILTNLTPGTNYYFQVKSTDPSGNTATDNNSSAYYTLSTLPGAAISHVTTTQINNNDATIVWDTDIPADSSVMYSPNADLSLPTDFRGSIGPTTHHSVTIASLSQCSRYYYYVKSVDGEGNVAIDDNSGSYYYFTTDNDMTPPVVSQISASAITDTGALITWATDERATSKVELGTAPSTYTDSSSTPDLNSSHAISLTGLAKNTTYYYRVISTDANSNTATSAESSFTTLEKQVSHPDLTDPGNPVLIQYSDTEAVLIMQTANTDSISRLCYSTDPVTDIDNCANPTDIATPTKIHSYHLTNLAPETLYYARAKVTDSEDSDISFTSVDTFSFTTLIKQVGHNNLTNPGDPAVTQKSDTEAVITLPTANTDSTSKLCYDTADISDMDNCPRFVTISDPTRIHSYHLIGLMPSTTYFIKTKVTDSEDASRSFISNSISFDTAKSAEFNHDPLSKITDVSDPPKFVTDKNAVITFSTDQPSLCLTEVTTSQGSYTSPSIYQEDGYEQKTNYNLSHSISLTDLIFSTKYYYKITCEDNLKTVVSSDEYSFTTSNQLFTAKEFGDMADKTPPVISNIKTSAITGESVTITWDTDEASNSLVRYGIDSNYGNMAGDDAVNSSPTTYATAHTVIVNNLIPATAYVFKSISYDTSGNIAEGTEQSFTTAAPSSISSIQVISTSLNQATITWNTSVKTTSSIEYGLKDTYGQIKEDTAMTQAHSISLSGLQSGATYHYRVKGKDQNNNLYASADNTFVPKSPPQITGIKIEGVTEHGAVIKFSTNVPTDALVSFTDPTSKANSGSQGKSDLTTSHELTLTNLAPGKTFAVSIKVRDQDGNETDQAAQNFTTGIDTTPPQIDQVITDTALTQNDEVQTIISWTTDEPATTSIVYKESIDGQEKEAQINDNYVTTHIAVSTIFKPGTVYYFKVKSTDVSGNEATSQDYALLTPKRKDNIIQIIISNFQGIFSWMKFN